MEQEEHKNSESEPCEDAYEKGYEDALEDALEDEPDGDETADNSDDQPMLPGNAGVGGDTGILVSPEPWEEPWNIKKKKD